MKQWVPPGAQVLAFYTSSLRCACVHQPHPSPRQPCEAAVKGRSANRANSNGIDLLATSFAQGITTSGSASVHQTAAAERGLRTTTAKPGCTSADLRCTCRRCLAAVALSLLPCCHSPSAPRAYPLACAPGDAAPWGEAARRACGHGPCHGAWGRTAQTRTGPGSQASRQQPPRGSKRWALCRVVGTGGRQAALGGCLVSCRGPGPLHFCSGTAFVHHHHSHHHQAAEACSPLVVMTMMRADGHADAWAGGRAGGLTPTKCRRATCIHDYAAPPLFRLSFCAVPCCAVLCGVQVPQALVSKDFSDSNPELEGPQVCTRAWVHGTVVAKREGVGRGRGTQGAPVRAAMGRALLAAAGKALQGQSSSQERGLVSMHQALA